LRSNCAWLSRKLLKSPTPGNKPQAPSGKIRLAWTYMRKRLSRGYCGGQGILRWCLAILIASLGARSNPAAAKRCAECAELEVALKWVTSSKKSQSTSLLQNSCVSLSYGFVPIQGEPFASRAALAAQTYIRPGSTRSTIPHARCEGAGSKAGWDLSPLRHLAAQSSTGHTSTLDLIIFSYRPLVFVPHPLRTAPCGTTPVSR
jgi:hypothetical protein